MDTNLYSRQIGTYGMETMGKLIQMKVLIVGLRGLGVETAKNIILAGPKEVSLYDPNPTLINDLGANFFLSEEDVKNKKRRDEACLSKLAELNPYVKVDIMQGSDILSMVKNYNVICITEVMNQNLLFNIDDECRKNKIGFIYSANIGITGYCFVDYGDEHIIRDKNGEECKTYIVRLIANDKVGAVTIDDGLGGGKLNLATGDHVVFREVGGMTELNDGNPREIKFISPISFAIGDTTKFGEYTTGGIVEQVKLPFTKKFDSFKERFFTPYESDAPDPIDFSKFGRNETIHLGLLALHEYYMKHNDSLPELNNKEASEEILKIAKEIYEKEKEKPWIKNMEEGLNESVILNIANWAKSELSPTCAFLGGIVAQEIVKFTGKYTPIHQWLWFEFSESVKNLGENVDRTLKQSRYDDQIAIYGNEIQKKLEDANIFMIGAGALGCEFLKNFALMGISINPQKKVTVTDNDSIEVSNLNRQFLFRKNNVGHSKSKCACEAIRKMNPSFNCFDLQSRVGPENEHIFNEKFWNDQTFVINAVDNVNARKYIDNQCTTFRRTLIDSGTLGTKAHVQMIVPDITSCYNDTQDPVEDAVPMCTMHNFPAMIEHCIEWGRDNFNAYFTDIISDVKKWAENPELFYADLVKEGNLTLQLMKLKRIKEHVEIAQSGSFDKCIEFAVKEYTENFDYRISQLLHNFPEDYKNKDGSMFWSGSKRVPHPIKYDAKNNLCFLFVKNYSIILARTLGIQAKTDDKYIEEVSSKIVIPAFVPKTVAIKVNDSDPTESSLQGNEQNEINSIKEAIKGLKVDITKIKPEEFEKDDDSNGHIDFIYACSNIRASNYKIKEADRQKTKMIAGKIIPAIATTTASITGIVSLQLYTLLQVNKIDFYRNCFLNLAVNLFVMTEPAEVIHMQDKEYDEMLLGPVKAVPPKWTVWDTIEVNGPKTVKEFIDFIKKDYQVEVSVITSGKFTIVQTFMPSNNNKMDKKIEEIYEEQSKSKIPESQKFLFLEVSGDIGDASALMPRFKYNFKA
ncbi:MAG: ThiF family adenylyltransferase [archaeon]|nr:ThiF family adenylyltransferase [archaeon]